MPAFDQNRRIVTELAEQRRQNANQDRHGTIHQVWSQNGETKYRVQLGLQYDGSPWLSPWLHVSNHRGAHREEHKFTKGQPVMVSNVGGDFRLSTVHPHSEWQGAQRPNHATDMEMTEQYDTLRERHGKDFHETWLAQQSYPPANQQSSGSGGSDDGTDIVSDPQTMPQQQTDDSTKAVTIIRHGGAPQSQQSQNGPWNGPPPNGGQPKKRYMIWAGTPGNSPSIESDVIHIQFNDKTSTKLEDGKITHTVGTASDPNIATTTITDGQITHEVGVDTTDFANKLVGASGGNPTSMITQRAGQIVRQLVGGGSTTTTTETPEQVMHQIQGGSGTTTLMANAQQVLSQVGQTSLNVTSSEIQMAASSIVSKTAITLDPNLTVPAAPTVPTAPSAAIPSTGAQFIGYIAGDTLTVLAIVSGYIDIGMPISGSDAAEAIADDTTITAINSDGTYTVDPPQSVAGASVTATASGTDVAVSAVTGAVYVNDYLFGSGAPLDAIVQAQVDGSPGGPGDYTVSDTIVCVATPLITAILITAAPAE